MPHRPPRKNSRSATESALRAHIDAFERWRYQDAPFPRRGMLAGFDIKWTDIIDYRINHPSALIQEVIAGFLSQRATIDAGTCDIRVDPVDGAPWMHHELALRALCLCALQDNDEVLWRPEGFVDGSLETDGWLLVEQHQIVGGAKFNLNDGRWSWQFVWIDPEHRRKGYVLKRLPQWLDRYGSFVADQPNQHALAMLRKGGYADRIPVKEAEAPSLATIKEATAGFSSETKFRDINIRALQPRHAGGQYGAPKT